jgi:glycosyltransferase involved in cell wall biosynthesis
MRLLLVADNLVAGGRERRLVEFAKHLSNTEKEICLVVLSDNIHYTDVFDLDIKVVILKRRIKKDPFVFFQLYSIFTDFKPHLVHSWGGMSSVYSLPLAWWFKVPFINGMIANSKCIPFSKDWIYSKLTFRGSHMIVSNSKIGLKAYGVNNRKGHVVYNGFNFNRLIGRDNEETENDFFAQFPDSFRFVVMVGSVNKRKDFPCFIKAALKVLDSQTDVCFVIIGDGEDRQQVEKMVPETRKSSFAFLGKIEGVDRFVKRCHIGVLATFAEGISNSIMEYMAFGKPVVVSDVPGNRELVEEGITGYFVPVSKPFPMAEKIEILLKNSQLCEKMGAAGKEVILTRFSIERMTAHYQKLYDKLLTNK